MLRGQFLQVNQIGTSSQPSTGSPPRHPGAAGLTGAPSEWPHWATQHLVPQTQARAICRRPSLRNVKLATNRFKEAHTLTASTPSYDRTPSDELKRLLFPERGRSPVRRRRGPDSAYRRPVLPMEAGAGPQSVPPSGKGFGPLCRESLLDGGGLAGRLAVAFTTAQRAIGRLEEAGVVAQVGEGRRNRVYCAQAVLDVLEEPPVLAG